MIMMKSNLTLKLISVLLAVVASFAIGADCHVFHDDHCDVNAVCNHACCTHAVVLQIQTINLEPRPSSASIDKNEVYFTNISITDIFRPPNKLA